MNVCGIALYFWDTSVGPWLNAVWVVTFTPSMICSWLLANHKGGDPVESNDAVGLDIG